MSKIKNEKQKKQKVIELIKDEEIIFDNVTHCYSPKTPYEFTAIKNASVSIKPGIITAIVGSTGSGKSTLIQHINALLIPTQGEVRTNGFIIKAKQKRIKDIKKLRKSIGLVFQFPEYQLFENTIENDIMFGPVHLGETKEVAKKNAAKYLKLVNLPESYLERSPFELSGGQKRRVGIAGILAMEGNTLILDEPTAGLDPEGELDFINLFKKINVENNKRIILVTHNMDHVLQIADEVVAMKKGEIVKVTTPFEVFADKQLIDDIGIEAPKIYDLIHKLKENGLDISDKKIRTIDQLVDEIIKIKQKQGKTGGES